MIYLCLIVGIMLMLLTACGPAKGPEPTAIPIEELVSPTEAQAEPTEVVEIEEAEATEEMEEAQDVEAEEETEETEEVVSAAGPDADCIACHTDKDRLIDTAEPVVEMVSENEGSG
jgi:hypothetical protein